jgi:Pyruvate/2-oxoacid:ferredoxin oxidoreductase delta subunit
MVKSHVRRSTSGLHSAERPRLVAVVADDCTSCNTCVDYCLVDCIEPAVSGPAPQPATPLRIREDECIGCFICAKVCEELDVNAIRMVPAEPVY